MGLIGKFIAKAALKTVEEAAIYGATTHAEKTRSVNALVNKSTSNYILFINKNIVSAKRFFTVSDESKNKKYTIKKDYFAFGYPGITLYDTKDNEVGKVELTSKFGALTYTMYHRGKELGTLKRKMSVKLKLDLDYKGWHLEASALGKSFTVTDKNGNVVMKFTSAFAARDTYVLELNNPKDEIVGLLLVMAAEITIYGND